MNSTKAMLKIALIGCLLMCAQVSNAQKEVTAKAISIEGVTLDQWNLKLNSFKPDIVVVDFWATWCSSCLQRFPHMVAMNKQYKDKGVRFVSMLLEDPEEPEALQRAKQFLQKQNADFSHYSMQENLMVSFEKLDLLGIPAVFIYAPDGQLAHRLTGDNPNKQFTEDDIKQALDEMITSATK